MANGKDSTLTASGAVVGGTAVAAKAGKLAFLSNPFVGIGLALGLSWLSRLIRRDDRPVATIKLAERTARVGPAPTQVVFGAKGTRTPCVPLTPGYRQDSIRGDNRSGPAFDYALFVSNGYCKGLEDDPVIWVDGEYIPLVRVPNTDPKHPNFPAIPVNARGWTNRDALRGRGSALARPGRSLMVYEYIEGGPWSTLTEVTQHFDREEDRWDEDRFMENLSGLHVRLWEQPLPDNPYPNEGNEEFRRQRIDEYISRPVWPATQNARFEVLFGGVLITWPGQTTPVATSNAAAIRWWFDRTFLRIPVEEIDRDSVRDAVNVCDQVIRLYMDDAYLAEYGSGEEGERAILFPRYHMNGLFFGDDLVARIEDEMDFAWFGRVAIEDGARVYRPGAPREPIHHLDESMFADEFPLTLQSGDIDIAVTRGVAATMAQSEHDFRRLPATATPALTFGQEDHPAEIRELGQRAFVTNHFQAATNLEYTRRLLRETRRAVGVMPVEKRLRINTYLLGDPVSLSAPSIRAFGNTWIIVGRSPVRDESGQVRGVRFVFRPDIDWRQPAVFPPLPRAIAGTSDPTGGGTEPPDPTVGTEPEPPPTET